MSAENITVRLQYDPNKEDTIGVEISQNATVLELEEKVKATLGKLNNVPMGILKFNGKELDNKDRTLEELIIKNNSEIKNENRVLIRTLTNKTIYITCDENTTVREFLKQLKDKNPECGYIKLTYASKLLQRSMLDQKLLGYRIGNSSINRGATLFLRIPSKEDKSDTVFDLNNPEESKDSNYPPLRIIVGIADLLLLAAAVATFLLYFLTTLSLSVAVPIVLAALFVVGAINTILPKILPEGCL